MSDLSERVQSVLGDAYRIERELPPGGMSRLFLATERSLDRQVVVKILPPELASEVSRSSEMRSFSRSRRQRHEQTTRTRRVVKHFDVRDPRILDLLVPDPPASVVVLLIAR